MKILSESEINELAARCEGHTADGAVTEANLHMEIAAPSLLDTCQALLREQKVLREALSGLVCCLTVEKMQDLPPSWERSFLAEALLEADAALAQVQDGGGK